MASMHLVIEVELGLVAYTKRTLLPTRYRNVESSAQEKPLKLNYRDTTTISFSMCALSIRSIPESLRLYFMVEYGN